jgi:hypothetical protein
MERLQHQHEARRQLQERYNEYLRFNEFLEMRGEGSGTSHPW